MIAFINSLALTGGFVGPSVTGRISKWWGSIHGGMLLLALVWLAGAFLVLAYRVRPNEARLSRPVSGINKGPRTRR